jgi:hypothetical protein
MILLIKGRALVPNGSNWRNHCDISFFIFRYVELPDIPQILAENEEALSKLIWLTFNASDNFHKEVAANTLFCCSNHPKTARKIIENQCHHFVLEKAQGMLFVTPGVA